MVAIGYFNDNTRVFKSAPSLFAQQSTWHALAKNSSGCILHIRQWNKALVCSPITLTMEAFMWTLVQIST